MRWCSSAGSRLLAVLCCGSIAMGLWLCLVGAGAAAAAPATELKSYQRGHDVSGTLTSIGSDTLSNLMTFWAEEFSKQYPNVKPQIESKGSATAPPALTEGTALLGPMSRKMKAEEEDAFEAKRGFRPTRIDVALDCLAVYVNKDNPVHGFTMAQLDCDLLENAQERLWRHLAKWGQAGLDRLLGAELPMSLYGRNSASGTYAYFKEHVLQKGDYKDTVKEQPGSAAVVNGIAKDRA